MLTEAEAYARCHGNRALCAVRVVPSDGGNGARVPYLRAVATRETNAAA